MSQYNLGLVEVTNGSPTVEGDSDVDWSAVVAGNIFTVPGSSVTYQIGSIAQPAGVWTITLTSNYAGATDLTSEYVIHESFTPQLAIPYPEQGDTQTATLFKRAMLLIEPYLVARPKVLHENHTPVGNTGGGEDDLMSYTVPAGTLAVNGDRLRITSHFVCAANANTKGFIFYWDGTGFLFTSGSFNAQVFKVVVEIVRTGAATQDVFIQMIGNASSAVSFVAKTATLSGAVVYKATGESSSSATNDIIQKNLLVEFVPAP